ncbi:hypothetical protein [Ferrimonas balearica]|uniref:hypothetical protein n=1 Tax=Ferrimonas balearica TaxID=44012 RepID=UPI001C99E842|nr:hypothetical protein [Ferrimonas balearica]MBY5992191.1 hypothetical protein [Ferrimonas balearica]
MEKTHRLSLEAKGRSYPIELRTITGIYSGGKREKGENHFQQTIYLEKADGKVLTLYSDFNVNIPPGSHITLIRGIDERKDLIFSFALYVHATDEIKWLSKQGEHDTVRRLITLTKGQSRRYHLRGLWTLLGAALFGWLGLWLGNMLQNGYLLDALTSLPYVLTSPLELWEYHSRNMNLTAGGIGAALGYFGAKALFKWPLDWMFNKANSQLVDELLAMRPALDKINLLQPHSGLSESVDDGYRDMFETA